MGGMSFCIPSVATVEDTLDVNDKALWSGCGFSQANGCVTMLLSICREACIRRGRLRRGQGGHSAVGTVDIYMST